MEFSYWQDDTLTYDKANAWNVSMLESVFDQSFNKKTSTELCEFVVKLFV